MYNIHIKQFITLLCLNILFPQTNALDMKNIQRIPVEGNNIDKKGQNDISYCFKSFQQRYRFKNIRFILVRGAPVGMDYKAPGECNTVKKLNMNLGVCLASMLKSYIDISNIYQAGQRKDFDETKKQKIYQVMMDNVGALLNSMNNLCNLQVLNQSNSICSNTIFKSFQQIAKHEHLYNIGHISEQNVNDEFQKLTTMYNELFNDNTVKSLSSNCK